jgi:predicted nucleic acid-binding protein
MRGVFRSRALPKKRWVLFPDCSLIFTCCPLPARSPEGWLDLLRRRPVTGGDVFDLQIVAAMQANGIQRIYTFNTDDFDVFPELAVLTP